MNAAEIIKQIQAPTPAAQREVLAFIRESPAPSTVAPAGSQPVQFASEAGSEAAGEKVMQQYDPVFRRLAQ